MEMTVIDMMNMIAKKTKALDEADAGEERDMAIEDAMQVSELSKQFFNGADLVLRAEHLKAKNKTLNESKLDKIIGE